MKHRFLHNYWYFRKMLGFPFWRSVRSAWRLTRQWRRDDHA